MFKQDTHPSATKGFTLIEVLTVASLIVVLGAIGLMNLAGRRSKVEVETTSQKMVALLREAQSNSMSQSSSTAWGVRFWNATATAPFFVMFGGGSYSLAGENGRYRLPERVFYASSTLAVGATKDVVFSQITGLPNASATVSIVNVGGKISSTISVSATGLVSF
ncbi:MAG: prepilin-type N-terminal cleavage/methylation domain-containing protein [Candidatus Liptonbacteria bacterium]